MQMKLIRFFDWQWDATISVAVLTNRVTRWQFAPLQSPYGITGQGTPVGAVRVTSYTFTDANRNGIIEQNEVQLGAYAAANLRHKTGYRWP